MLLPALFLIVEVYQKKIMESNNQNQQQNDTAKKDQQQSQQAGEKFNTDGGLKEGDTPDIPDSTNNSKGAMGSGQRQDSN